MPNRVLIDLDRFRDKGVRVYSGRQRGKAVRSSARLDEYDARGDELEIHVPEDLISLTSSFFGGMFGPSIIALGEAEFRRRFAFTGKDITRVIEDGIAEALKESSPLRRAVAG
jgi:hypothetical protein